LYHRANGYSHKAEKIAFNKDGEALRTEYTEHYPPDAASAIFWLKTRARWSDAGAFSGALGKKEAALAQAQQPQRVWRIGSLSAGSSSGPNEPLKAFTERLSELGYTDGKNTHFERRVADGAGAAVRLDSEVKRTCLGHRRTDANDPFQKFGPIDSPTGHPYNWPDSFL
jgi:hypothetical protein